MLFRSPLIDGLDRVEDITLVTDVPANLCDRLVAGETDLSLCSVIDQQVSSRPLELVPVGQIGCDGETRTVALFSRVPLEEIEEVACDVESHTSVALVQVLLAERTGRRPRVTPFPGPSEATPDSVLLIGDKVARLAPSAASHPHRVDLGLAWKELTGLPFVFAAWFRLADAVDEELLEPVERVLVHRPHHVELVHQEVDERAARRAYANLLSAGNHPLGTLSIVAVVVVQSEPTCCLRNQLRG